MDEDFDSSTADAWTRFQARLADHLLEMEEDDLLLVEAESWLEDEDGAAPYVQFCAWGQGQLRCEAVSNQFLADTHRLDETSVSALVELGFEVPTWDVDEEPDEGSANFWVDSESAEADRVAVMAVRALRDVYGVAHPAFLTGLPADEDEVPFGATVNASGSAQVEGGAEVRAVDEEPAVYPTEGREHLQRLVDETLTPGLGHPPVHDDDGDVPIDCGDVVVFVRVLGDKPVIRLFACVASDITELRRATFEVGALNRDQLFFKFLLIRDAIVMQTDIVAWPFAPAQLRDLVEHMCRSVGQIHDDLEARLGGSLGGSLDGSLDEGLLDGDEDGDEVDPDDVLHPAMHTLLELDADDPGWVDPMLAAAICDHDRELILRLLTWVEQQGPGDRGRERRMIALLRGALRVTVERQARSLDRRDPELTRRAGERAG